MLRFGLRSVLKALRGCSARCSTKASPWPKCRDSKAGGGLSPITSTYPFRRRSIAAGFVARRLHAAACALLAPGQPRASTPIWATYFVTGPYFWRRQLRPVSSCSSGGSVDCASSSKETGRGARGVDGIDDVALGRGPCSIVFRSSRMLPGNGYISRSAITSGAIDGGVQGCRCRALHEGSGGGPMSRKRAPEGGMVTETAFNRS